MFIDMFSLMLWIKSHYVRIHWNVIHIVAMDLSQICDEKEKFSSQVIHTNKSIIFLLGDM